jgi:ABC-2 type transport system permease protein
VNWLRVLLVGGLTSYRALFNWISPWVFFPILVIYPLFQILFFAYLGRSAGVGSDEFFLIGNTFIATATAGLFGMGHAVANERRSQTLASILASPASRVALFLGRTLPSIVTGVGTAILSFGLGALLLDVQFSSSELTAIALAVLVASFACTAMGLCVGAIGLRGRNVSLFADTIAGSMLLVSGANVPLDQLPGWIQTLSSFIPITHAIEAAREVANGATIDQVGDLLLTEGAIGLVYLLLGFALVRFFEYQSRRQATLETF